MSVFRVERTKDYTVMSNYHLRDKSLSLKAKGLLSQMLSLPEDWDYTLSGLSYINKESKDAIRTAVKELEDAGYVVRHQKVGKNGKFGSNEYIIYESPLMPPSSDDPSSELPPSGKPTTENTSSGKPTQLNTDKQNTDLPSTESFHSFPQTPEPLTEWKRKETISTEHMKIYRGLILDNIEYETLKLREAAHAEDLEEIVELMVETVCANRETTRVAGSEFPHEVVRSRLLKLNSEHISFVMSCMRENTTKVRNMKQYLLTVLFNAPVTFSNYYSARINHDLYGGSQ